ncbi:MAG: phenylalanine--tRNA ligase subunit alpha [Canidatus Methanoxibalbensis ujae]|nr:phenylalanine--tRNA ligase subunit alpha [Candidatus Methanoxibalbensis ujae]
MSVRESELSARERIVLNVFAAADEALTTDEIARRTGLKEDAVSQAAFMLAEKGIVAVKERESRFYRLTEEGREYAERGLPERRAIEVLMREGTCSFEHLRDHMGSEREALIAVNWLLKRGWARTKKECGKSVFVFAGVSEDSMSEVETEERILRLLLERGGFVEEEALPCRKELLKTLKARKLVEEKVRKERFFSLAPEFKPEFKDEKAAIGFGLDVVMEHEVAQMTPEMIRTGSWKEVKFKEYDVSIPSEKIYPAKIHPYQRLVDEMRRIFAEMGFKEIKGAIIQHSFWNFDALFVPQDHPAREMQDTFYLGVRKPLDAPAELVRRVKEVHEHGGSLRSSGWGGRWREEIAEELLLRTHTTAVTLRYLASHKEPPVRVFCIGRVYRRETVDPTHLPEFDQLEGIVMDENVSFRHLLGILQTFYRKMGFPQVRFRPGYFPYTEPSVEVEVMTEKHGWIELGGAGIFREEVTHPLGISHRVLAWGLGIGRLAMLKLKLHDIRQLYQPDIDWLRHAPSSPITGD